MPRTGVNYDDVKTAIQILEKAGLNPSIRLVREKLGKGSLTTIADHKRTFEAERSEGPTEALPDPIAKSLIQGAQGYWRELVDAAEGEIDAARQAADADVGALKTQLQKAEHETSALQDSLGTKISALDALEKSGKEQMTAYAIQSKDLQAKDVDIARLETELKALRLQHDEVAAELRSTNNTLTESESERARLDERLERQATEFAKEKTTLQKHFKEYRGRLVTMSDDNHEANGARRRAEKLAITAEQRASETERENQRLGQELADAKDEARLLTEKVGEFRGQLGTIDERQADDRKGFERLLSEKDERANALGDALSEAQNLVRQYVPKGVNLAQELIEERKSGG